VSVLQKLPPPDDHDLGPLRYFPEVQEMVDLHKEAQGCQACPLSQTRKNVVWGKGRVVRPLVCFVGEAPGADEDEQALPFVGASGRKLDQWIEWMGLGSKSEGTAYDQVYIMNTVMCRPPKNRNPYPDEIACCSHYFWSQLKIIKPSHIVVLGKIATLTVLDLGWDGETIRDLRGKWHHHPIAPVRVTYHPAYIKRNPPAENLVLEDLKAVRESIDRYTQSCNNK